MNKHVLKPPSAAPRIITVNCTECRGAGIIKLWSPGRPETVHMGRCEQCSGFGRMSK